MGIPELVQNLNKGDINIANKAIDELCSIAMKHPGHLEEILNELIKVQDYKYGLPEHKDSVCGKVLLELAKYSEQIKGRASILSFIQNQVRSTNNETKRKAKDLLEKLK